VVIYISLLNEGTERWRLVEAEKVGADSCCLVGFNSEDGQRPVNPADVLQCKPHRCSDGSKGLVPFQLVRANPLKYFLSMFASDRWTVIWPK